MTARQLALYRRIEHRLTRVAIGAAGLVLVVAIVPQIAAWMVG